MAKIHPQHATAGEYHLETRYADGKWEWSSKPIRPATRLKTYTGSVDTLSAAKKAAMTAIGLATDPDWTNIGPAVEVSD